MPNSKHQRLVTTTPKSAVVATKVAVRAQAAIGGMDEERIRIRAYQLHREGGVHGTDAVADWLCAEREYREALRKDGNVAAPVPTFSHEVAP